MDVVRIEEFYKNKRVFVTGHTGFKGAWLSLLLTSFGARVTGYALSPPAALSLFSIAEVKKKVNDIRGDIRDRESLNKALRGAEPEIVFHLAAQAIVRASYEEPAATFETNVQGTVNLLEAVRGCPSVKSVVAVTSDKCYQNRGLGNAFVESDPLGGDDPYSASKACAEIVAHSWGRSFFRTIGVGLATARAGNVIGGGDFAKDRLVPDIFRAFQAGVTVSLRNPLFVRPWQYVLDPLFGYLLLGRQLWDKPEDFAGAWNFRPPLESCKSVQTVTEKLCELWGGGAGYKADGASGAYEAQVLRLDAEKATKFLGWKPVWDIDSVLSKAVIFEKRRTAGESAENICFDQISEYMETLSRL